MHCPLVHISFYGLGRFVTTEFIYFLRQVLKQFLLQFIESGTLPFESEQAMIKEKASVLVAQLAVREWPQRWPTLTDSLGRIANCGHLQAELVVRVLRNLAEVSKVGDTGIL